MEILKCFKKIRTGAFLLEWQMRLLGLEPLEKTEGGRGLVLLQIDGLSLPDLKAALAKGHMPFLSWLLRSEYYKMHPLYSGIPSNTPAFQGEFFFGKTQCVPAFQFLDRKTQKVFTMFERGSAEEVEKRLLREGQGLMAQGSAYGNIFSGGAAESHVCAATADWAAVLKSWNPYSIFVSWLMNPWAFIRAVLLCCVEAVLAFVDFVRGAMTGQDVKMELSFIFMRILGSVLVREIATAHAQMDLYRGLPVVQVNFFGYDEQAHRRGPSTRFAYWSLSGIDRAIRKIWKAAMRAEKNTYEVWIYSDHGQSAVTPFQKIAGKRIQDAVQELFQETQESMKGREPYRSEDPRRFWGDTVMGASHVPDLQNTGTDKTRPVVTTLGPISQIYFPSPFSDEEKQKFADALFQKFPAIPLIAIPLEKGEVQFRTAAKTFRLPEDAPAMLGKDHPYLKHVSQDVLSLLKHESRGDLMLFGWCAGALSVSFSNENGSHAGLTPRETQAFALMPDTTPLRTGNEGVSRALDLRRAALGVLGRQTEPEASETISGRNFSKLRVLSYNVHSCTGTDGVLSIPRIARVIAGADPDVVCLQELDAGRRIPGGDQAAAIARELKMHFYFHPVCGEETQAFGNAVLSRYPIKKIKTWKLPVLNESRIFEGRGVLWVEIDFLGRAVQVVNTHLSVWKPELEKQVEALLAEEELCLKGNSSELIFCGDFNFTPKTIFYRKLTRRFQDVHKGAMPAGGTWPNPWPVRKLDYIFKKGRVQAEPFLFRKTSVERSASDHLPVIADFTFEEEKPR